MMVYVSLIVYNTVIVRNSPGGMVEVVAGVIGIAVSGILELEPIAEAVAGIMELETIAEAVAGNMELEPIAGMVDSVLSRIEPVGGVVEGIVGVVELLLPSSIRIVYTNRIGVMDACIVIAS